MGVGVACGLVARPGFILVDRLGLSPLAIFGILGSVQVPSVAATMPPISACVCQGVHLFNPIIMTLAFPFGSRGLIVTEFGVV